MCYVSEMSILGLVEDCQDVIYTNEYNHTIYVSEYSCIGGIKELLQYLANPHLVKYNIRIIKFTDCEDDPKLKEYFDILTAERRLIHSWKAAYNELYEKGREIE